ncbi:uncharacterized protein [Triticum aestivum]|uniref:uncharacterized protein n=1 Tax=Triticum aestivum TaxID=4565 RepID=UPI001D005497|nr:uncharacterized protein LOC123094876 [Triticum aestivum]
MEGDAANHGGQAAHHQQQIGVPALVEENVVVDVNDGGALHDGVQPAVPEQMHQIIAVHGEEEDALLQAHQGVDAQLLAVPALVEEHEVVQVHDGGALQEGGLVDPAVPEPLQEIGGVPGEEEDALLQANQGFDAPHDQQLLAGLVEEHEVVHVHVGGALQEGDVDIAVPQPLHEIGGVPGEEEDLLLQANQGVDAPHHHQLLAGLVEEHEVVHVHDGGALQEGLVDLAVPQPLHEIGGVPGEEEDALLQANQGVDAPHHHQLLAGLVEEHEVVHVHDGGALHEEVVDPAVAEPLHEIGGVNGQENLGMPHHEEHVAVAGLGHQDVDNPGVEEAGHDDVFEVNGDDEQVLDVLAYGDGIVVGEAVVENAGLEALGENHGLHVQEGAAGDDADHDIFVDALTRRAES